MFKGITLTLLVCSFVQAQPVPVSQCPIDVRYGRRLGSKPPDILYGVNHYTFDASSVSLLDQLDPGTPVPVRIEFDWQSIQPAPATWDFRASDQMVNVATQSGVPILGILAYSAVWSSSMPQNFDVTEVAPFQVAWHSGTPTEDFGHLPWGADDPQLGSAKYLWNARTEDGLIVPRVAYLRPAQAGYMHGLVNLTIPQGKSVTLESKVGFLQQSPPGSQIDFSITYSSGGGFSSLLNSAKVYDGTVRLFTVDVTALAGQTLNLFWNMDTIPGSPAGDPILEEARLLVDGVPLSMSTFLGDDVQSVVSYPPQDPSQFATFAGQLAARYPQIQAWEVWNEPNLSFYWRPATNAGAYAQLLELSSGAIKTANPSATVVMGGLSAVVGTGYEDSILPDDYLNQIYQTGGRSFDVVAVHPYGDGQPGDYIASCIQRVRDVMVAQNDFRKRIWVTEIGWDTQGPDAVDEITQAENICQARATFERLPSVERVYWYCLQDGSGMPGYPAQYYGLFRSDGTPKPAAHFFR
jgi:hypothetical protein